MNNFIFRWICLMPLFFSCGHPASEKFDREEDFFKYFKTMHNVDFALTKTYVVILQSGFCGSCAGEVFTFLQALYASKGNDKHYLVVDSEAKDAVMSNFSDKGDIVFLTTDKQTLGKYGLRYTGDLFFELRDGTITYWAKITSDNRKKISERFGIKLAM